MVTADIFYGKRKYEMRSLSENDCVFKNVWKEINMFYEYQLLTIIKHMNLSGCYVDVGSNVGNHSVFFATQCKCNRLICIDPCVDIREAHSTNMEQNAPGFKYEYYEKAVSSEKARGTLSDFDLNNVGGVLSIDGVGCVEVVTLDEILAGIEDIRVIKIDVEFLETNAIRGAIKTIEKNTPALIIEITSKDRYDEIEKELSPFGYFCDGINKCPGWAETFLWSAC
jgi:FkbM family methyltransferase